MKSEDELLRLFCSSAAAPRLLEGSGRGKGALAPVPVPLPLPAHHARAASWAVFQFPSELRRKQNTHAKTERARESVKARNKKREDKSSAGYDTVDSVRDGDRDRRATH